MILWIERDQLLAFLSASTWGSARSSRLRQQSIDADLPVRAVVRFAFGSPHPTAFANACGHQRPPERGRYDPSPGREGCHGQRRHTGCAL